ncbi:MAG: hypothetical protein KKB20_06400 [Proteobacteria bacterium]|nr:hypothetical protein [Pseudomonadota bacterium]
MLEPTIVTWVLIAIGLLEFLVLLAGQTMMVLNPQSQKTKDFLIGKGEDWRDRTHVRTALGMAWADLLLFLPLILAGSIGAARGTLWGYALWAASGAISAYISVILWFSEREYVYPQCGPLVYYTIYWGLFLYWGIAVLIYAVLRLQAVLI